ncbi:hypothetical protein LXL04_019359 [Taraxacum kok-saghyz]
MKLSDFGLCKPLDCRTLSTLSDENIREPMEIDGFPDAVNGHRWKSAHEQLQHWQMNRRKLIVHWRNHLRFPEDAMLSPEAKDLIYRLLCDVEHRLGTNGPDQIKFKDVMWDQLYEMKAAFKPEVNGELDTQNFMKFNELNPKDLNFVGYTYKNFDAVKTLRDNPIDLMRSASSDSLYGKQNNLISMT